MNMSRVPVVGCINITHLSEMRPEIFVDIIILLFPIMLAEMAPEMTLPEMQEQSVIVDEPVAAELALWVTTVRFVVAVSFFSMLYKFFLRIRLQLVRKHV